MSASDALGISLSLVFGLGIFAVGFILAAFGALMAIGAVIQLLGGALK